MQNYSIGIFDSGVGGLTVTKEIIKVLPYESIVYLGDTANLPYGDKSPDIIKKYSEKNTEFLLNYNIKVLVVACNTASAIALSHLKEKYKIPIIGVIEPAAKGAIYATRNNKIGVIGTNATINSKVYENSIKKINESVEVFSKACPLFVPLIEENFINHPATKLIAKDYLEFFKDKSIDTLILGCTHYPLIKDIIKDILPEVKLIDSAFSTANDLRDIMITNHFISENNSIPEYKFFATDITEKLQYLAKLIMDDTIANQKVNFEKVVL